jgi:protein-S-isoprenylcysteine O-methyltransferase Ste14
MNSVRLISGYILGFSLFGILIPFLLVSGHQGRDEIVGLYFFSNVPLRLIISTPVFCLGLVFALWSNVSLLRKGEGGPTDVFNVAISPRSQKLVISGPYKYCRNPMVFGMLCIYFSVSVFINSVSDLLILAALIPLFILYLKKTEEKRLIKDFGNEFLDYRAKVAMIVPFCKIRTNGHHSPPQI